MQSDSGKIKILAVGDVVGQEATDALCRRLFSLREQHGALLCVVNGENAAEGNGLDRETAERIFAAGADVITTGNHVWRRRELYDYLDECPVLLRPLNYPGSSPGSGSVTVTVAGRRFLVINVMGTVFTEPLDNPFFGVEAVLNAERGRYDFVVLDVHAEATSEKAALARYFDGRINVVFGTHTHVQTSDARVLPGGTAFITDLGMTGPYESILGVMPDRVITMLSRHMPARFETAKGDIRLGGALFTLDAASGRAVSAETINERL